MWDMCKIVSWIRPFIMLPHRALTDNVLEFLSSLSEQTGKSRHIFPHVIKSRFHCPEILLVRSVSLQVVRWAKADTLTHE